MKHGKCLHTNSHERTPSSMFKILPKLLAAVPLGRCTHCPIFLRERYYEILSILWLWNGFQKICTCPECLDTFRIQAMVLKMLKSLLPWYQTTKESHSMLISVKEKSNKGAAALGKILTILKENNSHHLHLNYWRNGHIYLIIPEGCEDKIHLNENTPKRKQSSHERDYRWCEIPFLLWNWTRNGLYAAGIVWSTTPVSSNYSTKKCQGEGDESPNDKNNYHCTKGNCS